MKPILTILLCFIFAGVNSSGNKTNKRETSEITRISYQVPDTTVYDKPVDVSLDREIIKMKTLKQEAKKVYDTSVELQKTVINKKQEVEIIKVLDSIGNNLNKNPR